MTAFGPDASDAGRITRRRVAVLTFVFFSTATAALVMADLLWGMSMRGWNGVVLALFTMLFALVSFGASQAFFGFLARRGPGDRCLLTRNLPPESELDAPLAPTAIVLPIYNEETRRVYAGLRAIYRSLERTGQIEHFDFFVLSDSTDPNRWIDEETGWLELSRELDARGRLFYRKRRQNTNKKAGNIADFCRRWGRIYRYMVVLDADSIVAGDTLVKLVRLMEQNPRVGLIQTAPALVRAESLYARILQFAMRLYGPLFLSGLNYWQQGEGNYWGHNAIIRLAPFMEHCALPELPGREPFGGKILSHDFVEAALLRRAGWAVWMVPDVDGTYEEGPPTLIDAAKRDRRWCQGNMQHVWLLLARGLRPISRIHLLLGIFAYSASLLWFLFLALGTLLVVGFSRTGLTWVPDPGFAATLGISPLLQSAALVALTVFMLFGPKVLAIVDLFFQRDGPARFGGGGKVIAGALLESLFSVVLAPVLMLFHAKFVVTTWFGQGVHWVAQRRASGDGTPLREAILTHGGHTLLGATWIAITAFTAPRLLAWMSPVLLGMTLSIPFSMLTSRASFGRAARRAGLFCTPEELRPPPELRDVEAYFNAGYERDFAHFPAHEAEHGLLRAVVDPYVNAIHLCLLRERARRTDEIHDYFAVHRETLLRDGPEALNTREKFALLSDAESIDWLHREFWRRGENDLAPWWREARRHQQALLAAA